MDCQRSRLGDGVLWVCRGGWKIPLNVPADDAPSNAHGADRGALSGHREGCAMQQGRACDCGEDCE